MGYHIEKRSGTAKRWVFVNRDPLIDTKYHVTDLFEEMEYEFRVSAENKMGAGPPSEPSRPVVTKDPCGMYHSVINQVIGTTLLLLLVHKRLWV